MQIAGNFENLLKIAKMPSFQIRIELMKGLSIFESL